MKIFLKIISIVFVCKVNARDYGDLEKYGYFQVALKSNLIKCNHDKNLELNVDEVKVHFYDLKKHDAYEFTIDEAGSEISKITYMDKKKKFILFVPGFKSNINKTAREHVRKAFEKVKNSYLMIVDHSQYTDDYYGVVKSYERAVLYVYYIAKALAQMLVTLTENRVSPKNIQCIGHCLGAQILGQTGAIFAESTWRKLAKITGLDPAGPCFSKSKMEEQVRSGVADYVEIYHCNAGILGTTSMLGDVDFFANKRGSSQPDCDTPLIPGVFDPSEAAKCNHRACLDIYLATVTHPDWFPATACDSYEGYKNGSCFSNEVTTAGFWAPGTARGIYYFSTKEYYINVSNGFKGTI